MVAVELEELGIQREDEGEGYLGRASAPVVCKSLCVVYRGCKGVVVRNDDVGVEAHQIEKQRSEQDPEHFLAQCRRDGQRRHGVFSVLCSGQTRRGLIALDR